VAAISDRGQYTDTVTRGNGDAGKRRIEGERVRGGVKDEKDPKDLKVHGLQRIEVG
jgi:hypothetical protein